VIAVVIVARLLLKPQGRTAVRSMMLAFLAVVALGPVVQPWYLLWVLPLAAASGLSPRELRVVLFLVAGFTLYGIWETSASADSLLDLSDGLAMFAAAVAVLLLAWVSWRFVEQPFRRENTVSRRAFFIVMGIGAVAIAGMGVAGRMTDAPAALYRATSTVRQRAVYDETFLPKSVDGDSECRIHMSDLRPQLFEQYERCVARYERSILVLGDSHAADLFDGLKQTSHRPFVVRVASESCDAAQPPCAYRDIFEFIRARRHTVQMVLYLNTGNKVMYGGRGGTELVPERVDAYFARLAAVAGLPHGPQVYMIGPYVEPRLVVQPLLRYAVACEPTGRIRVPPDAVQRIRQIDAAFAQRAPAFPAVHYISTFGRYSEEKDSYLYDCGALYWRDGDHLTAAGTRRLIRWLAPSIPELVTTPGSDPIGSKQSK